MILKGSQRAGAKQLANHLLRTDENDHVTLHDIRGFVSNDLTKALIEAYAISRGTRCKQFLYSLSLNPPSDVSVAVPVFEKAIAEAEKRLGLEGLPRVIVFHEKKGRRHAHCVWSRIDPKTMKAVNIAYPKLKLQDISKQLYLEHGWQMPRGFVKSEERNPLNFSQAEWQQALRIKRDPKQLKQMFQECWAISDSLNAFKNALESRGYYLAKGDRRGHVAVDWRGEIFAISRWAGVKTRQVREKLGEPDALPSVEEVKKDIARRLQDKKHHFSDALQSTFKEAYDGLQAKRLKLVAEQRQERTVLEDMQRIRAFQEQMARAERFRKGLKGLWDRITGKAADIKKQNIEELKACNMRDELERQALIERHLQERRALQNQIHNTPTRYEKERDLLETSFETLTTGIEPDQKSDITPRRRKRKQPELRL
jgi:hypothetical protein